MGTIWEMRAPTKLLQANRLAFHVLRCVESFKLAWLHLRNDVSARQIFADATIEEAIQSLARPTSGASSPNQFPLLVNADEQRRHQSTICCGLVSLRDVFLSATDVTEDPLSDVEELFGAVRESPVEFAGTFSTSWHRAVMDFGSSFLFDLLDFVGFNEEYSEAEEFAASCEAFDEVMIWVFLGSCPLQDLIDFVLERTDYEISKLEANLQIELFRAWAPTKPLPINQVNTPPPMPNMPLSKPQEQVLKVVKDVGHRLTTKEVLAALNQCFGPSSEGTTKLALAQLVRLGVLTNRQDVRPRGYGLKEWG